MHLLDWLAPLRNRLPLGRTRRRHGIRQKSESLEARVLLAATNPIDLSTLDGMNGFRLDGIDVDDYSGRMVSGAGDVNGDGFDDIIISADGADPNGESRAGESYVVFGKSGGFSSTFDLSTLDGTNGFRLEGIDSTDFSGLSLDGVGDFNGDGFDDLIVSAPFADRDGIGTTGESYLVFGQSGAFPATLALDSLDGTNGFRIDGVASQDYSGKSVSGAGEINGDGFADVIIGARDADPNGINRAGQIYVLFGHSGNSAAAVELASLDGTNGFRLDGIDVDDMAGFSVSGAGDFNGDGFGDLIIGARDADPNGDSYAGESYIVFGAPTGIPAVLDLSTLDGTNGFRLNGIDGDDRSGRSVSGAGDINGDGFDDVIIGAYRGDPNGDNSGESYVLFGASGGFAAEFDLATLNGSNGFRLDGIDQGDVFGYSVSGAGDVNADGFDDLIIGARWADPSGDGQAGESYVVFGAAGGFPAAMSVSLLDGTNGFRLDGIDVLDLSGESVSGAGDVNGDGFDDLIIGASGAGPAGESYVFFGGNFTGGVETQVGDDGDNTLTAMMGASVDILIGGQGNDLLISDGGDDILRGAEGDDTLAIPDANFSLRGLQGGNGFDTLRLDGSGIIFDLSRIADNRITGIEQIDIQGTGNNKLVLNLVEVLNLSDHSNTLFVKGGTDDRVILDDGSWDMQGVVNIDGINYEQYIKGAATVNVQSGVSVTVPRVINPASLDGTNGFRLDGIAAGDYSGMSVSTAGDFNGDGFDDMLIGAYYAEPGGRTLAGEVYLVFGGPNDDAASFELSGLDGTNGFRIPGRAANDQLGTSINPAGDINGDGFDDLILGAGNASPDGVFGAGESYVIFGTSRNLGTQFDLDSLDGTNGFRLPGIDPEFYYGWWVDGAGDVNGDGYSDIIISVDEANHGTDLKVGDAYVIFGAAEGFPADIDFAAARRHEWLPAGWNQCG
ncbi:MAG: integrin alpha [Planctomycetaceae bacterium]